MACMPQHPNATAVALAASRAKQILLTQPRIASALGASQSQVSRILSGKTSPSSKLAADICKYVSQVVTGVSREAVADNDELMDALTSVWDGSPGHARALAAVIRSLALLNTSPLSNRSRP